MITNQGYDIIKQHLAEQAIAFVESMWEIVKGFADTDPYVYNDNSGMMECLYCFDSYGWAPTDKHTKTHDADCLWLQAHNLVEQAQEREKEPS